MVEDTEAVSAAQSCNTKDESSFIFKYCSSNESDFIVVFQNNLDKKFSTQSEGLL